MPEHSCDTIQRFCRLCERVLPLVDFCKSRNSKFGYAYRCRECQRELNVKYKERRKKYYAKRRAEDPGYLRIIKKARVKYNRSEKGKEASKRNHKKFRTKELVDGRKYYHKNRKKRIMVANEWRLNNIERARKHTATSLAKRKNNIIYNLADRIRQSLRRCLIKNGICKTNKTFELLGYTSQELFNHLKKFLENQCVVCQAVKINISNCHTDHIIPCKTAKNKSDAIKLNQLSNLRLICANCNLRKGVKYE